jgi:hypothetical protein
MDEQQQGLLIRRKDMAINVSIQGANSGGKAISSKCFEDLVTSLKPGGCVARNLEHGVGTSPTIGFMANRRV